MEDINLEQTKFNSDNELKSYLGSLVLEYASQMNEIEKDIFDKSEVEPKKDFFLEFKQRYLPVFETYCSDKQRVYGGQANSFGYPTKYDGIEMFVQQEVTLKNSNRAEVYFRTENSFEAEYLFVLERKKGLWRIDNAKVRWYNETKWDSMIL